MKRLLLTLTMTMISFHTYTMKRENPYTESTATNSQTKKSKLILITPYNSKKIATISNGKITVTTPDMLMYSAATIIADLKNNSQVGKKIPTIIVTGSPRRTTHSMHKITFNKNFLYPQQKKIT